MERPYPETDAQMIKDNSIDNGSIGLRMETAENLNLDQSVLNDEPLAAGPDLASQQQNPLILRAKSLYGTVETRARQNPWLAIAAAGAGALAVGFIVGKLFKDQPYTNEEYPSGYEE